MKAFSYLNDLGYPRIGIETDEGQQYDFTQIWEFFKEFKNVRQAPSLSFLQVMVELDYFSKENIDNVLAVVRDFRSLSDVQIRKPVKFDVPISRPQKILCLGRNYKSHAEEWGATVPEEPMFFAKLASALLPHEGAITIPDGIGRVDHEIELAVVLAKKAYRVPASKAMDAVAGYTVTNDVSARDLQLQAMKKKYPWTRSKGLDTFCPMGPYLIPADAIDDPHALNLELRVNGEIKQRANTRDLVFKIPELVSYISRFITLMPGDIICTGTPEGTLPIVPGDLVEAHIDRLGVLRNPVKSI